MTEAKKATGLAALLISGASLVLPGLVHAEEVKREPVSASEQSAGIPDLSCYEWNDTQGRKITMLYVKEFDDDVKGLKLLPNPVSQSIEPGWFFRMEGDTIDAYYHSDFQDAHNKKWNSGELNTKKTLVDLIIKISKEEPKPEALKPEEKPAEAPAKVPEPAKTEAPAAKYSPSPIGEQVTEELAELARQKPLPYKAEPLDKEKLPAEELSAEEKEKRLAEVARQAPKSETNLEERAREAPATVEAPTRVPEPEKPEAVYSVEGMSILKGIEALFPRTWEGYIRNDAELVRELRKEFGDLGRYMGKPDTFADDDYENSVVTLSEFEKSLKLRTEKNTLYKGKATAEEMKKTLEKLKNINSQYTTLVKSTRDSLRQFEATTANSSLLSAEANQKIAETRKNYSDRIKELDKLWLTTDNLIKYIQRVSESEGFSKPETLVFDPEENPQAVAEFLYNAKKQAQEEFRKKDETGLYQSWLDEFLNPRVTAIRDIFKGIRNQYIDAEKVGKIIKDSQIGDGTANTISGERGKLDSAITTLSDLLEDKEPVVRFTLLPAPRIPRERRAARKKLTLAERIEDIPYGGVLGLSYSTGFLGLVSPTSEFVKYPLTSNPQFDTQFGLTKAVAKILFGYRVGPAALVAEAGYDFRKNPASSNQDLGAGLTYIGNEQDLFRFPFGLNAELHGKHVFAGIGYGGTVSLRQNTQGTRFNGAPIEGKPDRTTTTPLPRYEHDARIYAGIELGQKAKVNAALQYSLREGPGARVSVFVPRNRNR